MKNAVQLLVDVCGWNLGTCLGVSKRPRALLGAHWMPLAALSVGLLTKIPFFSFIQNHQFIHQQHMREKYFPAFAEA